MNQNPEQLARDRIDDQLTACGWIIQDKKSFNLSAGIGVAIREYQTNVGPADYILFINGKPVGIIEAKREEEGVRLTMVEDQSAEYATTKLKYIANDPLPFVYESTEDLTRFTDYRDPKSRSWPLFTFHRPQTFESLLRETKTLRARMYDIPLLGSAGLLEEQRQIVQEIESRLSVCDKVEETITDSLKQAEALRQSILKRAFEGKIN